MALVVLSSFPSLLVVIFLTIILEPVFISVDRDKVAGTHETIHFAMAAKISVVVVSQRFRKAL